MKRLSRIGTNQLVANQFIRKGRAFFRVQGDGVIQVAKYEYEPHGNVPYILSIGLMSMYSQLEPQWFTSMGCIPRYGVARLKGLRDTDTTINQESILLQEGLPWLNEMLTQKQLLDGMIFMETSWGGHMNWIDTLKIAPFLAVEDYASAEGVITAILQQHQSAKESRRERLPKEAYEKYCQRAQERDAPFEYLLSLIQHSDKNQIQAYLNRNFIANSKIIQKKLGR